MYGSMDRKMKVENECMLTKIVMLPTLNTQHSTDLSKKVRSRTEENKPKTKIVEHK